MAIDFSRYASNYANTGGGGGGGMMSPITRGMEAIAKARGTHRERQQWKRDDKKYKYNIYYDLKYFIYNYLYVSILILICNKKYEYNKRIRKCRLFSRKRK